MPNRFVHGYGPNLEAFKEQIAAGVQLIITVDNGVAGHAAVAYAMAQGVDVIITDHHELPAELPAAYAIVHLNILKEAILLLIGWRRCCI